MLGGERDGEGVFGVLPARETCLAPEAAFQFIIQGRQLLILCYCPLT